MVVLHLISINNIFLWQNGHNVFYFDVAIYTNLKSLIYITASSDKSSLEDVQKFFEVSSLCCCVFRFESKQLCT